MNRINIFDFKIYYKLYSSILYILKNKKYYNKNKKIIINFFTLSEECISTTKKCEELRKQYKADIERVQKTAVCTPCTIAFIKNEYIHKLINAQI